MNWNNLKNFECPKCSSMLDEVGSTVRCESLDCDFACSKQKFDQIVESLYKPKIFRTEEEDNQEALNNL